MVLKRKRSDSEISRASSLFSSPLSSTTSPDFFQSSDYRIQTPSLFSSRTQKRHRDNRPSEEDVYQHTLSLLFSAQQNNPPQFGSLLKQSPIPSISQRPESHTQQSSLHAFWRLPHTRQISPPSNSCANWFIAPTSPNIPSFSSEVTNCEDCDAPLICNDSDAMDIDIMMAIDNMGEANYSCTRCAKPVCSHCSVNNLGRERKCLGCVGRSQNWPGDIK